jgi:hypothetical protein
MNIGAVGVAQLQVGISTGLSVAAALCFGVTAVFELHSCCLWVAILVGAF